MSLSAPGVRLPRRIDSIERRREKRAGSQRRCEDRAMQVLRMFCAGRLLKQIAGTMKVKPNVVSYDIARMMRRYKVKTHAQLGVYAIRNGLLEPSVDSETSRAADSVYSNGHARADEVAQMATEAQL